MEVGVYYAGGTSHFEELPRTEEWTFRRIALSTTKLVEGVEAYVGAVYGWIDVDDFDLEACAAVGGVVIPVNTFALVSPWLAIISLVGCVGTAIVVAKKCRP